jgi:hypothetical protein
MGMSTVKQPNNVYFYKVILILTDSYNGHIHEKSI